MYAEERKNNINEMLTKNSRVTVKELAKKFKVSQVTIRHDLAELENAGVLTRTFGGAVLPNVLSQSISYDERKKQNIVEKKEVASKSVSFIKDGMTIFLDAGTTTAEIVPLLKSFHSLTVFTVDLNIALNLSQLDGIVVYMIGGKVSPKTKSTESCSSVSSMRSLYFDLGLLGCDAFNQHQFEINSEDKAELKKVVIKNSTHTIMMADGSKFGKHTTRSFAVYADIDHLVTEGLPLKYFNPEDRPKIV